ncbi:uncharacterized protein LOC143638307 [Callospermophilus lateralis]|uniref:uncharacterized protein LOC143638307 n=1 Tax=Callospermophilus lateralis TaxID=76772 RepID=UPI004053A123
MRLALGSREVGPGASVVCGRQHTEGKLYVSETLGPRQRHLLPCWKGTTTGRSVRDGSEPVCPTASPAPVNEDVAVTQVARPLSLKTQVFPVALCGTQVAEDVAHGARLPLRFPGAPSHSGSGRAISEGQEGTCGPTPWLLVLASSSEWFWAGCRELAESPGPRASGGAGCSPSAGESAPGQLKWTGGDLRGSGRREVVLHTDSQIFRRSSTRSYIVQVNFSFFLFLNSLRASPWAVETTCRGNDQRAAGTQSSDRLPAPGRAGCLCFKPAPGPEIKPQSPTAALRGGSLRHRWASSWTFTLRLSLGFPGPGPGEHARRDFRTEPPPAGSLSPEALDAWLGQESHPRKAPPCGGFSNVTGRRRDLCSWHSLAREGRPFLPDVSVGDTDLAAPCARGPSQTRRARGSKLAGIPRGHLLPETWTLRSRPQGDHSVPASKSSWTSRFLSKTSWVSSGLCLECGEEAGPLRARRVLCPDLSDWRWESGEADSHLG